MRSIELPVINIGDRSIRYITLCEQNETKYHASCMKALDQKENMPSTDGQSAILFLGADVLSDCSLLKKNVPRFHSKYSRTGMACKVNFPSDLKLKGVHGNNAKGLWFYSVQGLFQVAFEIYANSSKKEIIEKLYSLWVRSLDVQVPHDIDLTMIDTGSDSISSEQAPQLHDTVVVQATDMLQDSDICISSEPHTTTKLHPGPKEGTSSDSSRDIGLVAEHNMTPSYAYGEAHGTDPAPVNPDVTAYIPHDLTQALAKEAILRKNQKGKVNAENWYLNVIAEWLGKRFYSMREGIINSANEFKLTYINRISHLPSEKDITKEVFPLAMLSLIENWLGHRVERPGHARRRLNHQRHVLLTLELMNNALISSLSHIVKTKLSSEMLQ